MVLTCTLPSIPQLLYLNEVVWDIKRSQLSVHYLKQVSANGSACWGDALAPVNPYKAFEQSCIHRFHLVIAACLYLLQPNEGTFSEIGDQWNRWLHLQRLLPPIQYCIFFRSDILHSHTISSLFPRCDQSTYEESKVVKRRANTITT